MAWVVNSFPQPSCPSEGQLGWVPARGGFRFWVGGRLRPGWFAVVSCCPFRARSSTPAPLAGAGRPSGALRKEGSLSSSPRPPALSSTWRTLVQLYLR